MRYTEVEKLQFTLENMESLAYEVEANLYIPPRFRKAPFTKAVRDQYVTYLRQEIEAVKAKVQALANRKVIISA
jgi:hypothetical protein